MISIITCSINPTRFAAMEAMYRRVLAGEAHEIIRIPDAKGMCEGYNRGLRQSSGQIVIFSHDDVEFLCEDFRGRLLGHLKDFDLIGVAGTPRLVGPAWAWGGPPYVYGQLAERNPVKQVFMLSIFNNFARGIGNIQALDGMFLAMHRKVAETVGFDEQTFTGFHHYDIDFTFRAHLAGFKLGVCCDLDLVHDSAGDFSADDWQNSAKLFMQKFSGKIPAQPFVQWSLRLAIRTSKRDELVQRLHPPHWDWK